ncbi:hypothetical protein IK146_00390 [Candidatus Saccharibacteria bacterium]|nr:hypothetical protein [Candidatus Saccharibacteria bacterium]
MKKQHIDKTLVWNGPIDAFTSIVWFAVCTPLGLLLAYLGGTNGSKGDAWSAVLLILALVSLCIPFFTLLKYYWEMYREGALLIINQHQTEPEEEAAQKTIEEPVQKTAERPEQKRDNNGIVPG